jgi:chemotaxis protein methyltransferase CheR
MQQFGEKQFNAFRNFIYNRYGINFRQEKFEMLQSKLLKLMLRNGIESYDDYLSLLNSSEKKEMLLEFLDEITIHKTDFFRERNHFDFITNQLDAIMSRNSRVKNNNEFRVWSAGCSSGEEAYTMGMTLNEVLPAGLSFKVLATDISRESVATAQKGIYGIAVKEDIEAVLLLKYFVKSSTGYQAGELLKSRITFRTFNLMDAFPFKKSFDMIFCRNVMIYFDTSIQEMLVDKFYNALCPGGLLFIGHSESLTGKKHRFKYLQPTIYIKE